MIVYVREVFLLTYRSGLNMKNFNELAIPTEILDKLTKLEFSTPTPIQTQAIPVALEGQDILGSAQTGTGKTLAFAIPLINHLMTNPKSKAIVITPTRELALQVIKSIQEILSSDLHQSTILLIGGDAMHKQLQRLRKRPRLIVGTPGRINDHLDRRTLELDRADFLVLDETDRMLDMGFSIQIDNIVKHMPAERQTLLFSATVPKNIEATANKYLKNPTRITVGTTSQPAPKIKQEQVFLKEDEKHNKLVEELSTREGSIIIFVKTKRAAERIAYRLQDEEFEADAIHGDLRQGKRSRVLNNFRKSKFRILVATDVAARGLDVPHVEHVINFNLPQCPEDYIHRIGRTARAGNTGEALCLISPSEKNLWNDIRKLIDPSYKVERTQRHHGSNGGRPSSKKSYGSKPRRSNSEGNSYGGRPSRSNNSEGNSYGGRPNRSSSSSEGNSYGGRPSRSSNSEGNSYGKPRRSSSSEGNSYGGRPSRSNNSEGNSYGGRPSRSSNSEGNSYGGRPSRSSNSEGNSYGKPRRSSSSEGNSYGGRPSRSSNSEGNSYGKQRRSSSSEGNSYGGRPSRSNNSEGNSYGKQRRSSSEGNSYGGRPSRSNNSEGNSYGKPQRNSSEGNKDRGNSNFKKPSQRKRPATSTSA